MGHTIIKSKKVTGSVKGGSLEKLVAKGQANAVQEVIEPDPLSKLSTEIENTPNQQTAHDRVNALMQAYGTNLFQLGGYLAVINDKKWFGPHSSLDDYCRNELGFRKGKGYALIKNYKTTLELNISSSIVEEVGWSKVALLCSKYAKGIINKEAFLKCLNAAKTVPIKQLAEQLKGHAAADGVSANEVTTMIFKPHPDQAAAIEEALEKAKIETDSEHKTVWLEHVALSYLSGPKAKKTLSPGKAFVEQFRALGITEALELVAEVDSDSDAKEMLVELLKEIGEEDALHLFDMAFPEDPDPASLVKAG